MSADLNWLIVRNNHAYLHKRRNVKKPFSSEPGNLKNVNSFNSSGFVRKKTIDIAPESQGKGIVLTLKTTKNKNKPAKNYFRTTIKSGPGPRWGLMKIRRIFKYSNYRKDLLKTALRRASAIHRSQKAHPFKNRRRVRRSGKGAKAAKSSKGVKKAE